MPEPHQNEAPIKRTPVEARQGGRSRLTLRVLVWSLLIAIVLLTIIYFAFFPRTAV